jgi:hypothetical protein
METATGSRRTGNGGLMQRNKIYAVKTLALVARELNEDEVLLDEITDQMDREDGMIWVYGVGDQPIIALSDDGVECLLELIAIHRDNQQPDNLRPST